MPNMLIVIWVLWYSHIKRNENAHNLAKQGSSNNFYGLILGVLKTQIKGGLQQWECRKLISLWKELWDN